MSNYFSTRAVSISQTDLRGPGNRALRCFYFRSDPNPGFFEGMAVTDSRPRVDPKVACLDAPLPAQAADGDLMMSGIAFPKKCYQGVFSMA
jgi:hypothetical protein